MLLGIPYALLLAAAGCGEDSMAALDETGELAATQQGSTVPGAPPWQAFSKDSVWNLQLPAQRQEVALPAAGLAVAPMAVNDSDYGIKLYFASASDPTWQITFSDYNSVTDNWSPPNPTALRAPAVMVPPTGSDGTVIVVDENRQYVYEMWQFTVTSKSSGGSPRARCTSFNVSDLRTSGIHRNVGITAAGLPGVGGLLRNSDVASGQPIRHKLWLALHSYLLFDKPLWPANQPSFQTDGRYAALHYGDVVALSQSYNVATGKCKLSPVMQRIAQVLQDFGGIVQDRGGDSVGLVSEVGALSTHLDISQNTMWAELTCLRQYLVKINNPWTGALPGGLGY